MDLLHFAKYKLWDPEDKEMCDLENVALPIEILQEIAVADQHSPIEGPHVHLWTELLRICRDNGFVIIRPTDLMDKNEREIYEGDIVREKQTGQGNKPWVGRIEFYQGMFCITKLHSSTPRTFENSHGFGGYNYDPFAVEVIGNIYENPELLESQHANV